MPKDINTALLLVNAIDELLGFLKDAVVEKDGASCRGFNRPKYKQFLQLDRTVACYAAEIGVSLPALEKLRPSLSLSMSKEVEFIGLSNLPGDWCDAVFMLCAALWHDEMEGIRACAEYFSKKTHLLVADNESGSKSAGRAKSFRKKLDASQNTGRTKLIAALTKHHEYSNDSCLNFDPIGNNALAKLAGVAGSTASEFFKREFKGHIQYKALCFDKNGLVAALKLLNQEYSPHFLYGASPDSRSECEK